MAAVIDFDQVRHDHIKATAEGVRAREMANRDPLVVIDRHVRKLAQSARTARRSGIDTLEHLRRVQIMALNDVRREILGRPH